MNSNHGLLLDSAKQLYVALLFYTGTRTSASIGINIQSSSTLVSTFDPNEGFLYNATITDFLKAGNGTTLGTGLGAPIAGTYFYVCSFCVSSFTSSMKEESKE